MTGTNQNISDTALWVALHRAAESDRKDALFQDPYARMLAGERGEEFVRKTPFAKSIAWSTITRTVVIDELILRLVQKEGVDLVVNLAAGLDTRPYRMALPASLRWVEADLPDIIDYKSQKLHDQQPICKLERHKIDLADAEKRRQFLSGLNAGASKSLVITEGLLVYLTREQATALATSLREAGLLWWITDVASPAVLKMMQKWFNKKMTQSGYKLQFAPEEGKEFFARLGWTPGEFRGLAEESGRINRKMRGAWLWAIFALFQSKATREDFSSAGIHLLKASL